MKDQSKKFLIFVSMIPFIFFIDAIFIIEITKMTFNENALQSQVIIGTCLYVIYFWCNAILIKSMFKYLTNLIS